MDNFDILNDNPFQADYEEKCKEYERKLKELREEKTLSNITCAVLGGVAVGLVSSAAAKRTEKKHKKALEGAWNDGYDTGATLTRYAAENYISGMNDGIRRLETK